MNEKTKCMYQAIKTEQDYDTVLDRLNEIFGAKEGTPEYDEYWVLTAMVLYYEQKHYPIDDPHPIGAIHVRMEDLELKAVDLVERGVFSTKAVASLVLNKKRALSLDMMRKLSHLLGIPIEVLVQPYELETNKKTEKVRA